MPEPADASIAASIATMSQQIVGLTETVNHLREDLRAERETYVRREVYDTRAVAIDREIKGLQKKDDELGDKIETAVQRVERAIEARRIPWTAVVSALVAVAALWLALTGGA